MKRTFWALSLCLLTFAPALGQQKEAPAPTIKRKADLVLVPAVVTLDGKPVTGLTAKDFVLLHNGKPESVEVFEEIDATPARVRPVTLPPRTVRNFAAADRRQDVVILVLDYLNSGFSSRARIHSFLSDMLRQFTQARTPVSIFLLTRDGLQQLQSFASDPENLPKALERWLSGKLEMAPTASHWDSPFAVTQLDQADRGFSEIDRYRDALGDMNLRKAEMTTDAIEQLSEAYRGVPGRKKLIWMSTGFPLSTEDVFEGVTPNRLQLESKLADRQERAWKSLNSANIAVYTIDSNGAVNPTLGTSEDFSAQVSGEGHVKSNPRYSPPPKPVSVEISSNSASLLAVAEKTGGRGCTEAPDKCVGEALADGTHYYILGFYLHGDNKPGWHKLKVNLNQSKAAVRSRDGFSVGDAPSKPFSPDKDEVMTALASPLDYTSVPLQLTWSILAAQGKDTLLELALFSPPGGIAVNPEDPGINVDYLAFIRLVGKTEGRTIPATLANKLSPAQQEEFAFGGFRFRRQIPLAPGRYEVRVLLRDNVSKKTGTISTLIDLSPASPAPKR
jgi:VWFA-related protein